MARLGQVYTSLSANGTGCTNVSLRLYQTGSQKGAATSIMGNLIQSRSSKSQSDLESGSVLCHHHDPDFGSGSRHESRRCACIQHSTSSPTRFPFSSHLVAPSFSHHHSAYGHESPDNFVSSKHRINKTNSEPDCYSHYHCCGVRSVPLTILERQSSAFTALGTSHFDGFVRKHSRAGINDQRRHFCSSRNMEGGKQGWDVLWQSLANKVRFFAA